MANNLEGKIVAVIGASSGIGEGIVRAVAEYHPRAIVLAARRKELLEALASTLHVDSLVVPTDVTNRQQIANLFDQTLQKYGQLDAIVNSAGVIMEEISHEDVDPDLIDTIVDTNFRQALHVGQQVARQFKKQGSGIYVIISSHAAKKSFPFEVAYNASKAGASKIADSLMEEWAELRGKGKPLYAFALEPGLIDTKEARKRFPDVPKEIWAKTPKADEFGRTVTGYLLKPKEMYEQGGASHLIETVTF